MFVFMPETENRTLEEIERYFSDTNRRATDRQILHIESMDQVTVTKDGCMQTKL